MAQPSPIHSWKSIVPAVVFAVKFGASSPMCSAMGSLRSDVLVGEPILAPVGEAPGHSIETGSPRRGTGMGTARRRDRASRLNGVGRDLDRSSAGWRVRERPRATLQVEKRRRIGVRTALRRRKAVDTPGVCQDNSRLLSAEGYPSGQRGQTVNLLAMPSKVRILPPPPLEWRGQARKGGCSSMVEPQPSKLMVAVRFRSPAPNFRREIGDSHVEGEHAGDDGFCENDEVSQFPAHIAQSVEHFLGKEEVTGSIPVVGSMGASG